MHEEIPRVRALLEDISRQTESFARATGLHCKSGCGKCCENPDVETTVTEMMPAAAHLWSSGEAEAVLSKVPTAAVCVFYKPDALIAGNGRCTAYEYRPGVCRLFGFSARKDKHGRPALLTCRVIKEHFPADYARVQAQVTDGHPVPLMSDHTLKVMHIDPRRGGQLMPINQALRLALERTATHPGSV